MLGEANFATAELIAISARPFLSNCPNLNLTMSVASDEFANIANLFGLDLDEPILNIVQKITDMGRGQELERALTKEEIKNKLWTWLSTP